MNCLPFEIVEKDGKIIFQVKVNSVLKDYKDDPYMVMYMNRILYSLACDYHDNATAIGDKIIGFVERQHCQNQLMQLQYNYISKGKEAYDPFTWSMIIGDKHALYYVQEAKKAFVFVRYN